MYSIFNIDLGTIGWIYEFLFCGWSNNINTIMIQILHMAYLYALQQAFEKYICMHLLLFPLLKEELNLNLLLYMYIIFIIYFW